MANLTSIDKMKLEKIFGMASGYVMDFSDRSFKDFVYTSTRTDISNSKYSSKGTSKANRLRAFWDAEPDQVIGKLLSEMLEAWHAQKIIANVPIQNNEQILFEDCQKAAYRLLGKTSKSEKNMTEDDFINRQFKGISLDMLSLDGAITPVLNQRLDEIRKCLHSKASLSVIFLCGSTLEGILLGIASKKYKEFNLSQASPKDKSGQVKKFPDWSLSNFIDVACSLQLMGEDVKKFSHALRDFRNYIHPYEQMASKFNPDEQTAKICWQVLQAAIFQLSENQKR